MDGLAHHLGITRVCLSHPVTFFKKGHTPGSHTSLHAPVGFLSQDHPVSATFFISPAFDSAFVPAGLSLTVIHINLFKNFDL